MKIPTSLVEEDLLAQSSSTCWSKKKLREAGCTSKANCR